MLCSSVAAKEEVPVEGAVAVSDPAPAAGERIYLYVIATPLLGARRLQLEITLPQGVVASGGAPVVAVFEDVAAGKTVVLTVPATVATPEPLRLVGSATIEDSRMLELRRAFVLELNARPTPAPTGRPGRDADGRPLTVYDGGK